MSTTEASSLHSDPLADNPGIVTAQGIDHAPFGKVRDRQLELIGSSAGATWSAADAGDCSGATSTSESRSHEVPMLDAVVCSEGPIDIARNCDVLWWSSLKDDLQDLEQAHAPASTPGRFLDRCGNILHAAESRGSSAKAAAQDGKQSGRLSSTKQDIDSHLGMPVPMESTTRHTPIATSHQGAESQLPEEDLYSPSGWSVGTTLHSSRQCIPCKFAFAAEGCRSGSECHYCHILHIGKTVRPCKGKRDLRRRLLKMAEDILSEGVDVATAEE